jgi:predicted AlkP superfamily phosphohydrolase/phosphomutase
MKEESFFIELLESKKMTDEVTFEIVKVHFPTGEKWSFMVWYGDRIVAKGESFRTRKEVEEVIFLMQNSKGWEVEE